LFETLKKHEVSATPYTSPLCKTEYETQNKNFSAKKQKQKKILQKKQNKKKRFQYVAISNIIFSIIPSMSAGINLENSYCNTNLKNGLSVLKTKLI